MTNNMTLTNTAKQQYAARIEKAGRVELLRITYELLIEYIDGRDIPRASTSLALLVDTLDSQYEMSHVLFTVYAYINKLLNQATERSLADARALVEELKNRWSDTPDVYPVEQPVVVGMTYGRGGALSETDYSASVGYSA